MAILIDPPAWPAHGTLWSHLVSDADYDELHAFAARLGLPRRSFDLDHYDVPASLYERAVSSGAAAVSGKDIVHELRRSGLRVRQVERDALRPVRRRQYLRAEWTRLGEAIGVADGRPRGDAIAGLSANAARSDEGWQRLGTQLFGRWNESHRSYHDERHLEDVLLALNHLEVRGERVGQVTLLAAWFHDAVYTGNGGSDELDSAALAVSSLGTIGLDAGLVQLVAELIVATTPGHPIEDPAAPLAHLLDSDLAIFAASTQRYEEYAAAVRREYAHVPEPDFAVGRAEILDNYLRQPAIYRTVAARQLWEDRARANLTREIVHLLEA